MRLNRPHDTIYAPATPAVRSAIAVIRVSGPRAGRALNDIAGALPAPRLARLARLRAPASGEILDQALVLWFPGPHSETGEDMAEFQVHGGRAVVAGVLGALGSLPGFRLARPGEFARRAFENGKLDLTAIEAIADLVAAETGAQRRLALRQLTGELDRLYEGWRARLMGVLAHVEALIDFPEEGLPADLGRNLLLDINGLSVELGRHASDRRGERLREGLAVAIVGPPNAGKSSLLNALVGRELAIVSALPGTTRDVIEAAFDLDGFPVTLADTAGLRETKEAIEREGVRRALARAASADLRLVVVEAGGDGRVPAMADGGGGGREILVVSKIDLDGGALLRSLADGPGGPADVVGISVVTGEGLGELRARLAAAAREAMETSEGAVLTRARHREAVLAALEALVRCRERLTTSGDNREVELELLGEDLRLAARSVGRITGRVDVEDMLDLVFREFCIGK